MNPGSHNGVVHCFLAGCRQCSLHCGCSVVVAVSVQTESRAKIALGFADALGCVLLVCVVYVVFVSFLSRRPLLKLGVESKELFLGKGAREIVCTI